MKKRVFLCFALCAIFAAGAFGEDDFYSGTGGEGHIVMFATSTLENGMYDKSDAWVTNRIRDNLISGLARYGGFECIDMQEARNILKIQQQLESGMYDDRQTVEIGKLIKAKEAVTIKTTRLPSGTYTLNVTLLNVETGKILTMYTSATAYENAESYALQAHYDCIPFLLGKLKVALTASGKQSLESERAAASVQVAKNRELAVANAAKEAELAEKARKAQEEQARREAEAQKAAEKAAAEKKARDAAARAAAEKKNPFANKTYVAEIQNGQRWDTYKLVFTSQNECKITITSVDGSGKEGTVTKTGSYAYENDILSVTANMSNQQVRHVQSIHWKSMVTFKNGYNTAYLQIPLTSSQNARQVRAEFQKR